MDWQQMGSGQRSRIAKKAIGFLLIADRFFAPFADVPIAKIAVLEPKRQGEARQQTLSLWVSVQ